MSGRFQELDGFIKMKKNASRDFSRWSILSFASCAIHRSRVFLIFLAVDCWPVTPLNATKVGETIILIGTIPT